MFSLRCHLISSVSMAWLTDGLAGISSRFHVVKWVGIVITGIPSYHTLILRAWTTKIFLLKFFRQFECISVHFFKVSLDNMIDASYENIGKLFGAIISGNKMLPIDRTL